MVVLRKIKASTLMETMVATVLIVVLFMMASLLLNSIFSTSLSGNNQLVTSNLQQLEYQYKNGNIAIPYYEELEEWNIALEFENHGLTTFIVLEATNSKTKKKVKTYCTLAE